VHVERPLVTAYPLRAPLSKRQNAIVHHSVPGQVPLTSDHLAPDQIGAGAKDSDGHQTTNPYHGCASRQLHLHHHEWSQGTRDVSVSPWAAAHRSAARPAMRTVRWRPGRGANHWTRRCPTLCSSRRPSSARMHCSPLGPSARTDSEVYSHDRSETLTNSAATRLAHLPFARMLRQESAYVESPTGRVCSRKTRLDWNDRRPSRRMP